MKFFYTRFSFKCEDIEKKKLWFLFYLLVNEGVGVKGTSVTLCGFGCSRVGRFLEEGARGGGVVGAFLGCGFGFSGDSAAGIDV